MFQREVDNSVSGVLGGQTYGRADATYTRGPTGAQAEGLLRIAKLDDNMLRLKSQRVRRDLSHYGVLPSSEIRRPAAHNRASVRANHGCGGRRETEAGIRRSGHAPAHQQTSIAH